MGAKGCSGRGLLLTVAPLGLRKAARVSRTDLLSSAGAPGPAEQHARCRHLSPERTGVPAWPWDSSPRTLGCRVPGATRSTTLLPIRGHGSTACSRKVRCGRQVQPKGPSTDERTEKSVVYRMEDYWVMKKKAILPFATAWTVRESIALGEISQSEEDRCHAISLLWGI